LDVLIGGAGNDAVRGGGGNDTMNGNKGNDEMHGGVGLDVMSGSVGLDNMFGGNGHDTMSGGNGHDILTGGVGSDVFVFVNSSDDDTITDFEIGTDTIQLIGLLAGDVAFSTSGANDTLITLSTGDTVLIENTTIAQLNTFSDFDFV
jgi:Ca2+-binding RTX toxin-like protein